MIGIYSSAVSLAHDVKLRELNQVLYVRTDKIAGQHWNSSHGK